MATIQSSDIAVHYGQHFVPMNGNPGALAVPVDAGHQYTTTSVPIQQYGRQQSQQHASTKTIQTVPADKPKILNHTIVTGSQHPVLMKIEPAHLVQQHLQQQTHQPKMWLLVEWEMPAGEPNTYSVIDSSELVLQGVGRGKETIHTGKTIFVKRGNQVQQATVVIISDDKQFIDTELSQLRKMAAENLQRLSGTSQDQNHQQCNGNVEHQYKRRRTDNLSHDEQEPVSPEYEPMPVQSHVANWVNNCKPPERVISPSPSVMSMHVLSGPANVAARQPPPMTFDQQTQTDTKFFPNEPQRTVLVSPPEMTKILSLQESILAEQKSVRMENEYNRKLMFDMLEKISSFADSLQQLTAKVESSSQRNEFKYEITEVKSPGIPPAASYVVLGTGGEESRDQASSMAESYAQRSSAILENTADNMVIDQIALQHDDSNMSFSQSRFSAKDETASNTSTPKNQSLSFSKRFSASALSLSNASVHSQHSNSPACESNKKSTVKEVLKDWADDDGGDDGEMTPIGPNNTMVKKQVLRSINWNNYKAATRKLLMTLFTREKLASHTLTGRPSPAFMGDRAKPVKDKLDQTIITDIISIITRSCNVSEPMVRTAITTKCADENKMSRMKVGRAPASTQRTMTQFVKDTSVSAASVESSNSAALAVVTSTPAGSNPKRIKRENKENVH